MADNDGKRYRTSNLLWIFGRVSFDQNSNNLLTQLQQYDPGPFEGYQRKRFLSRNLIGRSLKVLDQQT